jgi:hypothetical protein
VKPEPSAPEEEQRQRKMLGRSRQGPGRDVFHVIDEEAVNEFLQDA